GLPQPDIGPAQLKLRLTARERVQFISSGNIRARWERSIVERTLVDNPGPDEYPAFQRLVQDGPATGTLFEHPSIEVRQMLRATSEVDIPLTGLGMAGPQVGVRVAVEAQHTENVPLLNGVEARAQFEDLARQLMAAPVPGLTVAGPEFWHEAVNDTL